MASSASHTGGVHSRLLLRSQRFPRAPRCCAHRCHKHLAAPHQRRQLREGRPAETPNAMLPARLMTTIHHEMFFGCHPSQPCTTSAFEAIYGTFKHQYYVVDASGNRKRIPIAVELDNDEGLGIFHLVTGNTQEAPVYHFESFFVGSRSAYAHNKSVELNRDCLD